MNLNIHIYVRTYIRTYVILEKADFGNFMRKINLHTKIIEY